MLAEPEEDDDDDLESIASSTVAAAAAGGGDLSLISSTTTTNTTPLAGNETENGAPSLQVATVSSPTGVPGFSRKQKVRLIKRALRHQVDLALLRQLAITRGGLVADNLRRHAWPLLLRATVPEPGLGPSFTPDTIEAHKDYSQVLMDVRRTLARFPPNMQPEQRQALQKQLCALIVGVLLRNAKLHYYQGFHDICITLLLVVGENRAFAVAEKLVERPFFQEFLAPTMEQTSRILALIYRLIEAVDPELCDFMEQASLGTMFALPWLITWYGHVISDFRSVVRLYDLFLASHPLMPLYFGAAIVLYRSREILSADCDMAQIHSLLSQMPANLPLEPLISDATDLFIRFPPSALQKDLHKWEIRSSFRSRGRSKSRRKRWAIVTRRKAFSWSFVTFSFTVAAWYLYNHYAHILNWDHL